MLVDMTRGSPRIAAIAVIAATIVACHIGNGLPGVSMMGLDMAPEFCTLVRWEDGDTPYIDCGPGAQPVRLLGIDTPESGFDINSQDRAKWQAKLWQLPYERVLACGKLATARAREICPEGSEVELRGKERDKYNRRLAYLRCDGLEINDELVSEGHAGRYPYPKDPERPALCVP